MLHYSEMKLLLLWLAASIVILGLDKTGTHYKNDSVYRAFVIEKEEKQSLDAPKSFPSFARLARKSNFSNEFSLLAVCSSFFLKQ